MAFDLQGAYNWAVRECQRSDVAYSQSYRNQKTVNGITYYDCSSFIFFALWLGGGLDVGALGFSTNINDYHQGRANAWVVTSMVNTYLPQVQGFELYDAASTAWQAGDILAKTNVPRERRHTEMCYAPPTQTMGAHNTANGVSINNYQTGYNYYNVLIRYTGSPTPPTPPTPPGPSQPVPIWLLKRAMEISSQGGITL